MSDELSAALRELAASRATAPAVDGAGIRARAIRRRRRRRTALGLGAGSAALVVLGFAVNLDRGAEPDRPPADRIPPAAAHTGSTPSPTPTPGVGTLDLRRHTLTVDGRVMPVLSKYDGRAGFAGPLRVAAKHASRDLPFEVRSKGPVEVNVPYVVELRDTDERPFYVGTFTKSLALGDFETGSDWIGLGTQDAAWFYARSRIGEALAVTTVVPPADTPSASAPESPGAGAVRAPSG